MLAGGLILIILGTMGFFYEGQLGNTTDVKVQRAVQDAGDITGMYNISFSSLESLEIIHLFSIISIIIGILFIIIALSNKNNEPKNNNYDNNENIKTTEKTENHFLASSSSIDMDNSALETNFREDKISSKLFSEDIFNELQYIFHTDVFNMIKQFPELDNNRSEHTHWKCSCGFSNKDGICIVCGANYADLKEKFNYTYINNHRIKRLKEEALLKEQIEIERSIQERKNREEEKARLEERLNHERKMREEKREKIQQNISKVKKATIHHSKNFISFLNKNFNSLKKCLSEPKNKSKVFIIGITFISLMSCFIFLTITNTGRIFILNQQAGLIVGNNSEKAEELYLKSNKIMNNEKAYIGLINIAIEQKKYELAAKYLSEGEKNIENNKKIMDLKTKYIPSVPTSELAEGVYKKTQELELKVNNMEYGTKIFFSEIVNSISGEQLYDSPIKLSENREYKFKVWSKNDFGFESNPIVLSYTLELPIPKKIEMSVSGGEFEQPFYLELMSKESYQIYYSLDGSEPNKSSFVYSSPIRIPLGSTRLKAVCYNDMDISSDVVDELYQVKLKNSGGLFVDGKYISGYIYDYFAKEDGIYAFSKDGKESFLISYASNAYSLNEYNDKLFYLESSGKTISVVNMFGDPLDRIENINASIIAVCHDSIYYIDSIDKYLYRANLDGSEKIAILKEDVYYFDVDEVTDRFYFMVMDKGVCYIDKKGGQIKQSSLNNKAYGYYFYKDRIYYSDGRNIVKRQNGVDTILKQYENYNIWYNLVFGCNNKLYFRKEEIREKFGTQNESEFVYRWYQLDLETEKISEVSVYTWRMYVLDEAIYDENMRKISVIN